MKDLCFIPFSCDNLLSLIPEKLNDPFSTLIPEICRLAATDLQTYIQNNHHNWKHNLGLTAHKSGRAKGKMFGVLVVKNSNNEIGYLSTFSGKLDDEPHPSQFVPSLFNIATNDYFITKGMTELAHMGSEIKRMHEENPVLFTLEIQHLKNERKLKSVLLQQQLFDQYNFLNQSLELKNLCAIFETSRYKKPAAGSGECAAPKLLQYAYANHMEPLAIAEFWWGKATKSKDRKHGHFYPACNEKCGPILSYMLSEEKVTKQMSSID